MMIAQSSELSHAFRSTEQRKLAAIMFTDMVGYSALSQRDDKLSRWSWSKNIAALREIFPPFHGAEIKTIGDAICPLCA